MTPAKERRLEKRQVILEAARRCFVRHGFHATGVAEICQEVGMSPGNLYRYFPSKSAVILAIVDEARLQMVPLYELAREDENPIAGIQALMLHCVRHLCDPVHGRIWMEIVAEATRNEEVREGYLRFDGEMRTVVRELLAVALAQGRLSESFNIEYGSSGLVALVDGLIVRLSIDGRIEWEACREALIWKVQQMLS